MKRILLFLCLLFSLPALAQNYSNVTASSITDASGSPLQSGTICFQPLNAQLQPTSFTAGGGGVVQSEPVCRTVTNGAITPLNLAASNYTSPLGIQYKVSVTDDVANVTMNLGYAYITGNSFSLDQWSSTAVKTIGAAGPASITGGLTSSGPITAPAFHGVADSAKQWATLPQSCPAGYSPTSQDIAGNWLNCVGSSYQTSGSTPGVIAQNPAGNQMITVPSGSYQRIGSASSSMSVDSNGNTVAPTLNGNHLLTQNTPMIDVRNFGAKVDGATDDTNAFQAAVTYAFSVGGIVYIPPGVMVVNGPINSACDAIVCIPAVSSSSQAAQIKIVGSTRVRQDAQGPATQLGSVITTTTSAGTDLNSAIIGVPTVSGNFGGLDNTDLYVSDITFRTYPNPRIGCVNGFNSSGAAFDSIRCEIGEPYSNSHTQPTNIVAGIQLPNVNNDTLSRLTWSEVTGYYVGVVAAEHAYFQGVWIAYGIQGLSLQFGYYPISGKIGMEEVQTPIFANGAIPLDITLGIEIDPSNTWGCVSWCYSTTDISDASNRLRGIVRYTKVSAGVGNTTIPLSITGGANLTTYNEYTQMWTNNSSPRTQSSIGVNPNANADGLMVGPSTEYGGVDTVIGNWNTGAAGEAQAGVLQVYNGGTNTALGTGHYNLFIQPFGGQTSIGNGGNPMDLKGSFVTVNGIGFCLSNGNGCNYASTAGCAITAGAIGNACPVTVTIPTQPDTSYVVTGCSISNASSGSNVIGSLGSFTTTSFVVTEIAMSTTATGGGTIVCSYYHP